MSEGSLRSWGAKQRLIWQDCGSTDASSCEARNWGGGRSGVCRTRRAFFARLTNLRGGGRQALARVCQRPLGPARLSTVQEPQWVVSGCREPGRLSRKFLRICRPPLPPASLERSLEKSGPRQVSPRRREPAWVDFVVQEEGCGRARALAVCGAWDGRRAVLHCVCSWGAHGGAGRSSPFVGRHAPNTQSGSTRTFPCLAEGPGTGRVAGLVSRPLGAEGPARGSQLRRQIGLRSAGGRKGALQAGRLHLCEQGPGAQQPSSEREDRAPSPGPRAVPASRTRSGQEAREEGPSLPHWPSPAVDPEWGSLRRWALQRTGAGRRGGPAPSPNLCGKCSEPPTPSSFGAVTRGRRE